MFKKVSELKTKYKIIKINKFFHENKLIRNLNEVDPILGMSVMIILTEFYDYVVEGKEPNMEDSDNE